MTRLLVSIVNFRVGDLVVDCLRSLAPEVAALPGIRVQVVDNASGDDSCERVREAIDSEGWGGWASVLALTANRGFSAGNNAAIRPALEGDDPPDFVFLLNPDTRVLPGALTALVGFAAANPGVGIFGSRIVNEDGTVRRSAFRFPTILGEVLGGVRLGLLSRVFAGSVVAPEPRDRPHPTDWISGAGMMIRAQVLRQVGLLDEGYFLYYEELDFCLRARRAGWECWDVPQSEVIHLVGKSTGVTGETRLQRPRPRYWYQSRQRYFHKNHGRTYAAVANSTYVAALLVWKVRRVLQGRAIEDPPRLLRDLIRYTLLPTWSRPPNS